MRELALFAGGGGGILGGRILGWKTVCAVEVDPFCRRILMARQDDGCLSPFPIWDDIRTFDGSEWKGYVDVVSGGFPCQPFSSASRGRRVAADLWPEMFRVVRDVRPRFVFAENVSRSPMRRAKSDLSSLGYGCILVRASAASVGAPHRRRRWWVVADTYYKEQRIQSEHVEMEVAQNVAEAVWPAPGPGILGMDDGVAHLVDRHRAVGNGQVPQVVAAVWKAAMKKMHGAEQ